MKKFTYYFITFSLTLNFIGCSVYKTIVNASRLKFELGNIENFEVSGVRFNDKTSVSDFNAIEILKLTSSLIRGTFPVTFILNVQAKNPNDGTAGFPRTDIMLKSFPWDLYIDNKQTVSGNILSPVFIPGTGEIVTIPIKVSIDLYKFIKEKDLNSLINLALAINGVKGHSSNVTLFAQPTVSTPIGDITYPGQLKIVGMNFTN